jgi:protein SCO1/2
MSTISREHRMTITSTALGVGSVVMAALLGIGVARITGHPKGRVDLGAGTYLVPPRAVPDFDLIDLQGNAFRPANLLGHWSLLLFGYTSCPGVCPTTLATLSAFERRLRVGAAAVRPEVIFVSADAKRDTPQQLADYLPLFDPEFVGVTAANQPAIESFARRLGAGVLIEPSADGNYTVDHSSAIYVVKPDGKLAAVLKGPFTVAGLQVDFQRIVGAAA